MGARTSEVVKLAGDPGVVNSAGFASETLTVGVSGGDGTAVLVTPDEAVPLGGEMY
jgi:tRNA-binding protein